MVMTVVTTQGAITAAINSFNTGYHADFYAVRCLAKAYLAAPPSLTTTMPLASVLSGVLTRWGGGQETRAKLPAGYNYGYGAK